MTPLLVALGAAAGAPLRLLAIRIAGRDGRDAARGTLAVNVAGSAALGLLLGWSAVPPAVVALLSTGFCGALTTFSTFGTDAVGLLERRATVRAAGYVAATLLLGIGAAAGGFVLGRTV
ncbi:fluoride efflux transporter FluC [Blastococcus xanthinilyticus]|uniref:Fluoride-specific ion channel FluC n=1 Tax=Blastococcus xanthinilyticus TaxID=1564164 RepID=A0A5S5CPY1_9ACTN|nr:CrcB family protein [Blastococcus xanthinilyticus]TYP81309.1 CrcB protein [Blastococcus xanthinilyticus]